MHLVTHFVSMMSIPTASVREAKSLPGSHVSLSDPKQKQDAFNVLLHSADVSNATRKFARGPLLVQAEARSFGRLDVVS